MPVAAAGEKSVKLVKNAELKVYRGAPHGLMSVAPFKERFNEDLLAFLAA